MKVIFLDFDGVLNNWDHFDGIDEDCIEILKCIQNKTNAKIVLTTSKKYPYQLNKNIKLENSHFFKTIKTLKNFGIDFFDITPYVDRNRCLEIKKYLELHPEIEQYLILDDEYIDDSLKEHQVYLDLYNGLQLEHIEPSIRILNGYLGFYPIEYNTKETPDARNLRINQYQLSKKI